MVLPQIILVAGASSGFGALTASHLARAGHIVYASMPNPDQEADDSIRPFVAEHKCSLRPLVLDVSEESSCQSAVETIVKNSGHLDTIVHNAGHMGYGPTEAFSPQQYLDYYSINCVGQHRVNRAALPHLRDRGSGLLLWIGSTNTRGGTPPFLGPCFAAKAGMDSLAVSYSAELRQFGIETSIIIPGAFTSGTSDFTNAGKPASEDVVGASFGKTKPYAGMSKRTLEALVSLEHPWVDAEEVARPIVRVVGLEKGSRPFRVHIDASDDGATVVNGVADLARRDFYSRMGLPDLLHVRTT